MSRKRIILGLIAVLIVGGVVVIAWTLAGLPPVRYVLRYGIHPGCEPTGEKFTAEGVTFVEIGPGVFRMGSTHLAEGGDWLGKLCAPFGLPWGQKPEPSDEMPVHWIEFRRGFWIATTEITNAQYERFKKDHERSEYSKGEDTPVIEVSWEDAKAYCTWLATKAERPIRLPSEAEWECACRAGSDREFAFGDDEADLAKHAWFEKNSEGRAHEVATKRPNRWGLSDLHGNVWEWCEDLAHLDYENAPPDGSVWERPDEEWGAPGFRIFRGGSLGNGARSCRSATRSWWGPTDFGFSIGFRPAFVPLEN